MANGVRGDICMREVKVILQRIGACYSRRHLYDGVDDNVMGWDVWKIAPEEDRFWIVENVEPGLLDPCTTALQAKLMDAKDERDGIIGPATDNYLKNYELAMQLPYGPKRDSYIAESNQIRREIFGAAWKSYHAAYDRAVDAYHSCSATRGMYVKVLRAAKHLLK